MTILKDEEGNEWHAIAPGIPALVDGCGVILRKHPKKRVPFEEMHKAASRLCDAIRDNIKDPDTATMFTEIIGYGNYIVDEALAQMEEKAK